MSKHVSRETSPSKRARTGAVAARESGPVPSVQARPQRASAAAAAAAFAPLPAPGRAQRSEAQKALSVLKAKETKAQKAREKAEKAREKAEKEAQQDIADADNQVLKAAKRASVAVHDETLFPGPNTQQLEAVIEDANLVIANLLEKLATNASRADEVEEAARQEEHSATAEQSAWRNQLLESLAQSNMKLGRELVNARERLATANSAKVIGQHAAQQHNVSQLTAEEGEATRRLEGLGFPRARVLEAYFACDKSEELAANYLFDHVD